MPNLTLTVDAEILKKARKRAIEKNTSISALIRKTLEKLAAEETLHREQLAVELMDAFENAEVEVGQWTRESLHEH